MKKSKLFIGIGIIVLTLGVVIYTIQGSKKDNISYSSESKVLSQEEATKLVEDMVNNIINIYENKDKTFNIDETSKKDKYLKVTNYDEIINNYYTENGKKELEQVKFNKESFVVKEDSNTFLLEQIPKDNQYLNSNITIDKLEISEESISCVVTLSTYGLKNDVLTYYIIEKNMKLVKSNGNWLVDTFNYSNS